jgi:hypothetical protein
LRQGLTTLADHSKSPGKRVVIPVKLTLTATDKTNNSTNTKTVEKGITLFGPGDVLGINTNVISRLAPSPNTNNFETSLVPFIEFSEPDLLWRFSSLQTSDKKNWIPWLTLIVLKSENNEEEAEFEKVENSNKELPPQIQIKSNAVLPDLKESWRWAHVYKTDIEGVTSKQLANSIKKSPKKAVCRLLCPRKLKPQTKYHAFLVPAFKIGAEAAMGITDQTGDRTVLTWETPADGAGKTVPYFFEWEFRTGAGGDFEKLVRKLKPRDLENMGTRPIDCSNPGYGMQEENELVLQMEAALKSLDTSYQAWGMDSTKDSPDATRSKEKQKALAGLLNKREEKIQNENGEIETKLRVTPPVYGEWYASRQGETVKVNPQNRNHWLEELNLDFRHRAAAGLGVQFVKENQESLMKAAWEQLSKVKKVNQELNLGRFGREVSSQLYKRLNKMKANNVFKMSLPVQNKIAIQPEKTVTAFLNSSKITQNITRTKTQKYLYKMGSAEVKTDFKPVGTSQLVSLSYKVKGVKSSALKQKMMADTPTVTAKKAISVWPEGVVAKTISALNPKMTIESRIKNRVSNFRSVEKAETLQSETDDQLHPVIWYPEFHRPMYHFLRAMSQENILPGLENVPQNTVGLLQTNRRFIEAFMVGLNHEMASELRWREFPTDLRGSYFRSFWDTSIYSVDDEEKRHSGIQKSPKRCWNKFRRIWQKLQYVGKNRSNLCCIANPNETEKEIADAYESAIEKWLLTRDEDKDIDRLAQWKRETGWEIIRYREN